LGIGGLQRFYVGKIWTGLLWFFTGGCFGIGQIVDAIRIATGHFTDKQGRRLVVWTDYEELDYAGQGRAPGWETPPPSPHDGPNAPASPAAAATDESNAGRQAASPTAPAPALQHLEMWASQVLMRPNRTNPLLAALGGLLMILSLISGLIGTLSRPAMTVVAAFDKNLPTWFDSFMAGSWQGTLDSLQMALSVGLMFLAILVLIVARRWAGGAHMFRAIVGAIGMLVSLHLSNAALRFDRIDWADKASLVRAGYIQDVLREVLSNAYTGGFVLAGLMMLGSVLVLAWPPRRQEQMPAVGKGV
jgi:hypothetical protein